MSFWESEFGKALMGALLGGALSLLGAVTVLHLQARHERRRHFSEQFRLTLIETINWWKREEPAFRSAAAAARAWTSSREINNSESFRLLAEWLIELLEGLSRRVPAQVESNLYWFGSEDAYRRFGEATIGLGWLKTVAMEERAQQIPAGHEGEHPADLDGRASERRARLLNAHTDIEDAIRKFDSLVSTLDNDAREERRRLRGDAQLKSSSVA